MVAVALWGLPQLGSDSDFNVPTDEGRLLRGETDTCSRDTEVGLSQSLYNSARHSSKLSGLFSAVEALPSGKTDEVTLACCPAGSWTCGLLSVTQFVESSSFMPYLIL